MIRFPIEASHVMMFERSIGAAPSQGGLAPPTFSIAADHFDPDYERRPREGVPWFGSGSQPVSVKGGAQQTSGGGSGFHAEERFVYHRPLRVGDVLFGQTRDGAQWSKQGRRGGTLRFFEHVTEYRDAAGDPVVTLTWIDVLTERQVDSATRVGKASSAAAEEEREGQDAEEGREKEGREEAPDHIERSPGSVALFGGTLEVGASIEEEVVRDLKRTQIVMYAGASGDFHPMHTDGPYAAAMGMPGVFAHGMLTMGITGGALTNVVSREALRSYTARFRGIVWPGDTLTTRLTLEGLRGGDAVLSIVTRNQKGESVLTGDATASCSD